MSYWWDIEANWKDAEPNDRLWAKWVRNLKPAAKAKARLEEERKWLNADSDSSDIKLRAVKMTRKVEPW